MTAFGRFLPVEAVRRTSALGLTTSVHESNPSHPASRWESPQPLVSRRLRTGFHKEEHIGSSFYILCIGTRRFVFRPW